LLLLAVSATANIRRAISSVVGGTSVLFTKILRSGAATTLLSLSCATASAAGAPADSDGGHPLPTILQPVVLSFPEEWDMDEHRIHATAGFDDSDGCYLLPVFAVHSARVMQGDRCWDYSADSQSNLGSLGLDATKSAVVEVTFIDVLNDPVILQHVFETGDTLRPNAPRDISLAQLSAPLEAQLTAFSADAGKSVAMSTRIYPDRASGKTIMKVQFRVGNAQALRLLESLSMADLSVRFSTQYAARFTRLAWEATGRVASSIVTELVRDLGTTSGTERTLFIPLGEGSLSDNLGLATRADALIDVQIKRRAGTTDVELLRSLVTQILAWAERELSREQVQQAKMLTFVLDGGIRVSIATDKLSSIGEKDISQLEEALKDFSDRKTASGSTHQESFSAGAFGFSAGMGLAGSENAADSQTLDVESLKKSVRQIERVCQGDLTGVNGLDAQQVLASDLVQNAGIRVGDSEFVNGVAEFESVASLQSLSDNVVVSAAKAELLAKIAKLRKEKRETRAAIDALLTVVETEVATFGTGDASLPNAMKTAHATVVGLASSVAAPGHYVGWAIHAFKVWHHYHSEQDAKARIEEWLDGPGWAEGMTRRQEFADSQRRLDEASQAIVDGATRLHTLLTEFLPKHGGELKTLLSKLDNIDQQLDTLEAKKDALDIPAPGRPTQVAGDVNGATAAAR
jgi:hypothetical protein